MQEFLTKIPEIEPYTFAVKDTDNIIDEMTEVEIMCYNKDGIDVDYIARLNREKADLEKKNAKLAKKKPPAKRAPRKPKIEPPTIALEIIEDSLD
jgi:hypothetical protein